MITKTLEKHDAFFQRFFEVLPGFMIWVLLLSPLWAGRAFPLIMGDFLIFLSIYWFYRATLTTFGTMVGYYRYKQAIKQDWLAECNKLATYDLPDPQDLPVEQFLPKHLLLYPQRVPQYDVLKTTLDALKKQNYPLELIYVAISFEERFVVKMEPGEYEQIIARLKADLPEFGDRLLFYKHPAGMQGEAIGAASNRTWGAKNAVQELAKRGEVIGDFLVTSPDEDIVFHREFLAAATYQYLTVEKRKQKFYQTALYTFNNNHWDVPILIRVLASTLTIPVLASSVTEKHKRETFSCFTLSLEVLEKVNYWDVSMGAADDTTFYWRPFFYFKGDWYCEVFYIPLSADAIYAPKYIENHRAQYKQYLRWGWGVISFPLGFKGLLKHTEIPFWVRITKMWHLFEVFVFWKVLAYLITFAFPIILLLNPQFNELVIWYSMPSTISKVIGLTTVFLIPATIYKMLIIPAKPKQWSKLRYLMTILIETPLSLITMLTFSSLPFVEASTRMMIGQKGYKMENWSDKNRK